MSAETIQEFLVAIAFKVNAASQTTAKKSVADYERAVREAEKRIEDARWAGAKSEQEIAKLSRETNLRLAREALERAKDTEKKEAETAAKRKERAKEFAAGLEKMALAAVAAATAIGYAVGKIAGSFDNLYFQAQRSGTSVQSLKALQYAFSQTGGTAQQASSAVDSFTTALRNNPGLRKFVGDLGVDNKLQGVDKLLATVEKLNAEPYEVAVQHAEMLGISEETYNLLKRQLGAVKEYRAEYDQTAKRIGLNSDEAARAATTFQRVLTRLQATASALADKFLIQLAPALERVVKGFTDWIESNPEKVERILKNISDGIVWLTEKLTKLVEWFGGDGGEAFLKRWDEFAGRIGAIGHAFDAVWTKFRDIDSWLASSKIYQFLKWYAGGGVLSFSPAGALYDKMTGQGGSAPAGADNRSFMERHLPKMLGGKDAPGTNSDGGRSIKPTSKGIDPTVEAYIRKAAAARGINPDTAVGVADGEGLGGSTPTHLTPGDPDKNKNPTSFGAFQMHRGGAGSVGTEYEKATGHKVDDPTHWQEQIDFSLNWAKKHGWNAWYGRSKHGIGEREGLNYDPNAQAGSSKQAPGNVPSVNGIGGIEQNQGGKTRSQPITEILKNQIAAAAREAGVNAEVYSGGQDESGPNRTGSHRHDNGRSADLKLFTLGPDGKKRYLDMNNEAERGVMEKFIRESVKNGANGVGAANDYMGAHGIHVGGGSPSAWGAGGASANAPDWVRRAHEDGMQARKQRGTSAAPVMPSMSAGIDPQAALQGAGPLGANSVTNNATSKAVTQHITNNVKVDGSGNPREHGRVMESSLSRVHGLALANAQTAVV